MKKYFSLRNRTILGALVRADFKVRYQGSVLGYAWSLLRPLLLFAVLYIIFGYVIPLGKDVDHYPVYLLSGIVLWTFFVEATVMGLTSVVARGDLLRKINIPRYLFVISSACSALVNLSLSLIVLALFAVFNGINPSFSWLLAVPLIFELFVLSVSIAFLLSSLYVKYRDISYIWEVFVQIGFYASAIIFPLSTVPENLRKWFFINPIVQIIQDFRFFVATDTSMTLWSTVQGVRLLIPFAIIMAIVVLGAYVFKRRSKTFAEEI